ncbi:copper chaperone PCu(A)C [Aureimonas pseudogalii]|uniref:Copper chaperone PCu(A)C n=1 Tax=Aureimonas pseudogalii TaxID=1744844 RepID=A0A7W6H6I1_9HYPH|nr:copper chaperone PCu(A)C [Aureimonas pseudogalii]MBB3999484.1 hypothetical protein [Aureimonas pseudogalii]
MTASSRLSRLFAAGLLLAALAGPAAAHGFKVGAIEIEHPWSRATPPGARTGAGYLAMSNAGPQADRLVSARSARAETVEVHRMSVTDGVMTMRRVEDGVEIPAGGTAALAPGSLHLMLMGLKAPLREGEMVPVTLTFEKAGEVEVELQVEAMGTKGPAHGGEAAGEAHAH